MRHKTKYLSWKVRVILASIEPKTGQRLAHVRRQRTKQQFTWFMQNLAQTYPNAEKITVILDNLNTHTPILSGIRGWQRWKIGKPIWFCLYPQVYLLAQYDRNRIFCLVKTMPQSQNCLYQWTIKRCNVLFQTGPPLDLCDWTKPRNW